MRVLIVGLNFGPELTGIAPYTTKVATDLVERGHDVRVLTTFPHYPDWRVSPGYGGLSRREVIGDVRVTRLRHYVPGKPEGIRRVLSELSFGLRAVLSSWGQPEVLITPTPGLISSALTLMRVHGHSRPAVGVIVQDLYSVGLAETVGADSVSAQMISRVESHTLRRADEVVVIHDRFKRRVVNDLGVAERRVSVIRNWTHVQPTPPFDRAEFRASMGWKAHEYVVLHTGAMGEKQGLSNVVDAARLADERNSNVRFVLVGNGGQRAALEDYAAGLGRLEFGSAVSSADYPKLLASSDLLLVNERLGHVETAVPSKLTSYFSSGRPVLAASDVGSTTAEELAASGAGLRVEPGDPVALFDAVTNMANDRPHGEALGSNGPGYSASVCSEQASLDAYDALVYRLADIKSRRTL